MTDDDVTNFYSNIIEIIQLTVQYNFKLGDITIDAVCKNMTNIDNGDPFSRFAIVSSSFNVNTCIDVSYKKMIDHYKTTSWDSEGAQYGERQWTWQTCTELGFFQTTDSKKQPFGSTTPLR
jgi:hypothetical protein